MRVPGRRAAGCLLAASVCELAVAGISLVLMSGVRAEQEAQLRIGDGTSPYDDLALSKLEYFLWSFGAAGVITLTLAVLVWRRGGSPGVRVVVGTGLVPYAMFCCVSGIVSFFRVNEFLSGYSHATLWTMIAAGLLYLVGTVLLLFAGSGARPDGHPESPVRS
ncbi:hypothetical protein ACFFMN_21130 [Planobispora siamensis]|uniref:Uncharacterized protein n=1 Tax=Planobispora siamensis TaxID=936338 RepID=A0A8J3SQ44_9ACTN|nr:hypothetical protein [Planobispora siamensis]GIH93643.1 hypothetical protein Psi01_42730 [Planobispora siamensis]